MSESHPARTLFAGMVGPLGLFAMIVIPTVLTYSCAPAADGQVDRRPVVYVHGVSVLDVRSPAGVQCVLARNNGNTAISLSCDWGNHGP